MPSNMNTTTRKDRLQKAKEGVGKHFANVSTLTIAGVTLTPADLMALIQGELDAMTAYAQAKAGLKVLAQAELNAHAKALPVLRGLKAFVIGMFGNTNAASSTLEDFGYSPRKAATTTLETKVAAQGKAKATRKARNTLGKKAKKAIKGGTAPAANPAPATPATPKP
jgi:hypothetical protein